MKNGKENSKYKKQKHLLKNKNSLFNWNKTVYVLYQFNFFAYIFFAA